MFRVHIDRVSHLIHIYWQKRNHCTSIMEQGFHVYQKTIEFIEVEVFSCVPLQIGWCPDPSEYYSYHHPTLLISWPFHNICKREVISHCNINFFHRSIYILLLCHILCQGGWLSHLFTCAKFINDTHNEDSHGLNLSQILLLLVILCSFLGTNPLIWSEV